MKTLARPGRVFIRNEGRRETVEYTIIAWLLVAGAITTIAAIGIWLSTKFTAIQTALAQ